MASLQSIHEAWEPHRDRAYIKKNRHGVPFLIAGKRGARSTYWAAFIIDPLTEKPISTEPFFHHEHLRSLEYRLDMLSATQAAEQLGSSSLTESLPPPQVTTTIINNITIDARSINIGTHSVDSCEDALDWARLQCSKMGWPEPPRRFIEGAAYVFNTDGGDKAIEYIGDQMRRRFAWFR